MSKLVGTDGVQGEVVGSKTRELSQGLKGISEQCLNSFDCAFRMSSHQTETEVPQADRVTIGDNAGYELPWGGNSG